MINGHPARSPRDLLDARSQPDTAPEDGTASIMLSAVTFLAGTWLIMAPVLRTYTDGAANWNAVITGIAITVLAIARAVVTRHVPWLTMANVVLGVWLVVAPFVLAHEAGDTAQAVANDVIVGLVVMISATAATALSYRERASTRRVPRA